MRDKRGVDRFAVVAGVVLAVMGLLVVAFFVLVAVALNGWGSQK